MTVLLWLMLVRHASGPQIIPQAVCSRYGLAVGAKMAPLVRVLVCIFFPVSYPISKVLPALNASKLWSFDVVF